MNWVKLFAFQLIITAALAQTAVMGAGAQTQPSISLQPDMISAGEQTTVSGAGFCGGAACSGVTITLDGVEVANGVPVNADGTFTVGFRPLTTPGRRIVAAVQDTPEGRISADALLTVTVSDQTTATPTDPPTEPATPSPTTTVDLAATPTPAPTGPATPSPTSTILAPTATPPANPSGTASPPPSGQPRSREPGDGGLSWWTWTLIAAGAMTAAGGAGWLFYRLRR